MIIERISKDNTWLFLAKKEDFLFSEYFSKEIPMEKIESYFKVQTDLAYEKYLGESK